jgi:tetratricopeptide (TPR) repeat protein
MNYELTLEWTQNNQTFTRIISPNQATKVPNVIRIGRDPTLCDVVIEDNDCKISRLHIEIFFNQTINAFYLRNATINQPQENIVLVDGELIRDQEVPLGINSVIQLRALLLRVINISVIQTPIDSIASTVVIPPTVEQKIDLKGDLKQEKSLIKRASEDDFEAIKTMFQQFIPEDEEIYYARYLGIKGFFGFGTRQFACVTERRIADITIGYFGELTYQDGYLEHIHSGFVYQPSRLVLYILSVLLVISIIVFLSQANSFGSLIINLIVAVILTLIILPGFAKIYYALFKCGLVLTVREGEFFTFGNDNFLYTNRLIYIFTNRKLLTRANGLYREFIIRREERLNIVENYPLEELQKKNDLPQLTPLFLSSSLQNYALENNNIVAKILIGLMVAGVGAGGFWGITNFVIPEIQLRRANDFVSQGNILKIAEDYEGALSAYNQAIELKPELAEAWVQKCFVLNILERFEESISTCEQAINLAPDAYLWNEKGNALLALNRQEEALESYQKAIEIKSDYSAPWYHQGIVLKEMGKVDQALNNFDQAIDGDGDFGKVTIADAWGQKCTIFAEERRYHQEAFTACDQRVQLVSDDYFAWKERGNALLELDREQEALESYQKATEIKSDYSVAWYNTAVVLQEQERLEEALNALDKAIQGDGDFGRLTVADAWNRRGVILYGLDRLEESLESFEKALEIDPSFDLARKNRDIVRQELELS